MSATHISLESHPITDGAYVAQCRRTLDSDGALVLPNFFSDAALEETVATFAPLEQDAFYAQSTHNVYLTGTDPSYPGDHPRNHQITSSKGLIADDEVPTDSLLRDLYEDEDFRAFLCGVLGTPSIHPYDDNLSSINVHFAAQGEELGWHFDNSAFAVTMLLRAPDSGGTFEYVPGVRDSDAGDDAYEAVGDILSGATPVKTLDFDPGALVLFRGRDAMHRVTPTEGDTTRLLVVFAYSENPGIALSDSALMTFYGRLS